MSHTFWKAVITGAALIATGGYTVAQTNPQHMLGQHGSGDVPPMHAQMMPQQMMSQQMMQRKMATSGQPILSGQDAFGAIQEIVRILEADPETDWSKVNLEALRQHLIDMNEVTLDAETTARPIEGGLEIDVTGNGRTLGAIQRMIPAHVGEIDGLHGWTVKASPLSNGELLTVTAADAKEVQHIRGLGFIGILVTGSHHQVHHLMMAKGVFAHGQ